MTAGGKRLGAGRPKGSRQISDELREAAQRHTVDALQVVVDVMKDVSHPNRLKAAQLLLDRAHGAPKPESASREIIGQFMAGEISAIQACLELEAEGLRVPEIMQTYFKAEMLAANFKPMSELSLDERPQPLPRA